MSESVTGIHSKRDWIPELPVGWEKIPLKYCVECLDGRRIPINSVERSEMQGDIPYWGAGGIVDYVNDWLFNEPLILLGEDGAPFDDPYRPVAHYVNERVWVNNHIQVLRARNNYDEKYLCHALNSADYRPFLSGSTRDKLTQSDMKDIPLPIPPIDIQKTIATFLDSASTKLEDLINKKQNSLDLFEEMREAIIEERLTPGLDAEEDFGTASWSNNLPDKWSLRPGKALFQEVDNRTDDGSEMLFSLRLNEGLIPHEEVSDKEFQPSDLIGYKQVRAGQLVMNRMRAATGLVGVAPSGGLVSPDYAVFETTERADPFFYQMLFQSDLFKTIFRSRSSGLGTGSAGFLRLYTDRFLELWFPHPPIGLQRQIVAEMDSQLDELNQISEATRSSIKLLKERRRALVTAAVTGQLDVSDWEPPDEIPEAPA